MPFTFLENGINSGIITSPNDYYRELEQAFIDDQWENTSAQYEIKEQNGIGEKLYHPVEAWIKPIVGTTSTGLKQGEDFKKFIFKNINHNVYLGLYYIFDDNYWITYFIDNYAGLPRDIAVRRCNNRLRIVDPDNGSIFSIPCVIDYDMLSPSQQVNSYIITPNNHAVVKVQGNQDTLRLFDYNTRYMLGGRPFKLLAYQNALLSSTDGNTTTYLELELYLDELHAKDDIINQLAYNGDFNYKVKINSNDLKLTQNSMGQLTTTIILNDIQVDRKIIWSSSDESVVEIDQNGNYKVVGNNGDTANITASLFGNDQVFDTINITVSDIIDDDIIVIMNPVFDKIRQYDQNDFQIQVYYNQTLINPDTIDISLSSTTELTENDFLSIQKSTDKFILSCKNFSIEKQKLYVTITNNEPKIDKVQIFEIQTVSMLV